VAKVRAPRLDELLGGDRGRRLSFGAFAVAQRQRCGGEGSLLVLFQLERLHPSVEASTASYYYL
jgi:hypothetical protein